MSDEDTRDIEPIPSPWRTMLLNALMHVQHRLLIVCPYIKESVVMAMRNALLAEAGSRSNLDVRVITRVDPADLLGGASDVGALQQLLAWSSDLPGSTVEMRVIPNLHAKVWVCDASLALVGSGNATSSGLDANLEYGIAIADTSLVRRILSDWQGWWDQAERVEAEMLVEIARQLQALRQSEVVRQNQEQVERMQRALNAIPRPGRRITFTPEKRVVSPVVKERPAAHADERVAVISEGLGELDQTAFAQALTVPVSDFWRALCWVLPFDEARESMIDPHVQPDAFLKIFWKATPADHQELRLIWADGRRYSQAALPVHNEAQQHLWAVTLNMRQIRMFGELLRARKEAGFFAEKATQTVQIVLNAEGSPELSIRYPSHPTNRWSAMVLPCTRASIPGSFPPLRMPRSSITISHEALQSALTSLQEAWEGLPATHPLTTVELRLGASSVSPTLSLSTGQIEAPLVRTISGKDASLTGLDTRIRLDVPSLRQVSASAHERVHAWQVSIDGYAQAIQFMPDPGVHDATLVWRHELRGLS